MKDTQKSSPLVSVIIPLYNHEKYIEETVMSVLDQSFPNFELIIINDGSTDNSEEVVLGIKDDRIKYAYQENQDAYNTINNGVKASTGKYISILNSDDVFKEDKLLESVNVLEGNPNVHAVFSDFEFVRDDGSLVKLKGGSRDNWAGYDEETSFKNDGNILIDLLLGNFLGTTSNLVCRRSTFDEIGGFLNYRYAHDYDFFLKLCLKYEVRFIDKSLFKYRFHGANTVNENRAGLYFDACLILVDFFMNNDFEKIYGRSDFDYETMVKVFNSLNSYKADKVMWLLTLFCMNRGDTVLLEELRNDAENPLRKTMIDYLKLNLPHNPNQVNNQVDMESVSVEESDSVGGRQSGGIDKKDLKFLGKFKNRFIIK